MCKECGRKHNDLLHFRDGEYKPKSKSDDKNQFTKKQMHMMVDEESFEENNPINVESHYAENERSDVLLATALVRVRSIIGWSEPIRGCNSIFHYKQFGEKIKFKNI